MAGIGDLLNLGPVSAGWLETVGIRSYDDLEGLGSVEAYLLVKEAFPAASANLLYALEGALRDVRWDDLPVADRAALREEARRRAVSPDARRP